MNRATLQRIAAATAVVCKSQGGGFNVLPLMKALYLADRDLLRDFGRTISGDTHASMPHGPVLSGAYDLCRGKLADPEKQQEWLTAFRTQGNRVVMIQEVDTAVLSEIEEEILRSRAAFVSDLFNRGQLEKWMHDNCPEWEDVSKDLKKSKPLPITRIAEVGLGLGVDKAGTVAGSEAYAIRLREKSLRVRRPLVAKVAQ